jgi:antitoxin (DNA-binding transcriptional repressor) of toxin-antitoxin stability system
MKTVVLTDNSAAKDVLPKDDTEEVIVMKDGRPIALVVPFDDDDLAWYARERDPAFIASIQRARSQVKSGQTLTHEQMKRELGIE